MQHFLGEPLRIALRQPAQPHTAISQPREQLPQFYEILGKESPAIGLLPMRDKCHEIILVRFAPSLHGVNAETLRAPHTDRHDALAETRTQDCQSDTAI